MIVRSPNSTRRFRESEVRLQHSIQYPGIVEYDPNALTPKFRVPGVGIFKRSKCGKYPIQPTLGKLVVVDASKNPGRFQVRAVVGTWMMCVQRYGVTVTRTLWFVSLVDSSVTFGKWLALHFCFWYLRERPDDSTASRGGCSTRCRWGISGRNRTYFPLSTLFGHGVWYHDGRAVNDDLTFYFVVSRFYKSTRDHVPRSQYRRSHAYMHARQIMIKRHDHHPLGLYADFIASVAWEGKNTLQ